MVVAATVDQLTKWWAETALADDRVIEIVPSVELDLSYNSGFSFSAGAGHPQLVAVFVMAVCVVVAAMIWRSAGTARLVLLSLVLGGALGNLADRLFRADDGPLSGEVVDFIDVTWYAVFNVADSLVVCGTIAFVVTETRRHRLAETEDEDAAAAEAGDATGDTAASDADADPPSREASVGEARGSR